MDDDPLVPFGVGAPEGGRCKFWSSISSENLVLLENGTFWAGWAGWPAISSKIVHKIPDGPIYVGKTSIFGVETSIILGVFDFF